MRQPVYTPRERACLSMADRVAVRLYTERHGWLESVVWPTQHEDLAALLRRVQFDLQNGVALGHRELERVCIYAVAEHPLWGEMRCALPRRGMPAEVEHPLRDLYYPVPASARRH
jgi:hypothetical protein